MWGSVFQLYLGLFSPVHLTWGLASVPFPLSNPKRGNELQKSFNLLRNVFRDNCTDVSYSKLTAVHNGYKAGGPELY